MPLDPQVRALLDTLASSGIPANHAMTPAQAREAMSRKRALFPATAAEPIARTEDRTIATDAGSIPIRLYWPRITSEALPLLLFFHGGGWVLGSRDTHDGTCRSIANRADCVVLSVDYRLAPEHPFPAAVEDSYAATTWAAANAASIGADALRLGVAGDSAGGNLATVVALMARDRGTPPIKVQFLIVPVTDAAMDTESYRRNRTGYGLEAADMAYFFDHYLGDTIPRDNVYVSPARTVDLSGLPSAIVFTAEYDPLRDEGMAYAERLRAAGVTVQVREWPGMVHGFFGQGYAVDGIAEVHQAAGAALREAFDA
jgi:acetyl esterase